MIREIVKDTDFLCQSAIAATREDVSIADDLADTLKAHAEHCVGLAANMIGEKKRIIAIRDGNAILVMLNPEIVKTSAKQYEATEGCLSLTGERNTMRYERIEVKYRDRDFKRQRQKFSGLAAQIIQHEIDHCNGILI